MSSNDSCEVAISKYVDAWPQAQLTVISTTKHFQYRTPRQISIVEVDCPHLLSVSDIVGLHVISCESLIFCRFLQRVSIACYAKRCTSYRKSVRLAV